MRGQSESGFYLLWISDVAGLYGMLRARWVPYLLVPDPARAARCQVRFSNTHAFLPTRNGIRPDALHVCLHTVFLATVVCLGVLTFSQHAFLSEYALPAHSLEGENCVAQFLYRFRTADGKNIVTH